MYFIAAFSFDRLTRTRREIDSPAENYAVRDAVRTLVEAVRLARAGQLPRPDRNLRDRRLK